MAVDRSGENLQGQGMEEDRKAIFNLKVGFQKGSRIGVKGAKGFVKISM